MFSIACLLVGHDDMMIRSPNRLWLRCQHCGRETAGWAIGPETPPRLPPSIEGSTSALVVPAWRENATSRLAHSTQMTKSAPSHRATSFQ